MPVAPGLKARLLKEEENGSTVKIVLEKEYGHNV